MAGASEPGALGRRAAWGATLALAALLLAAEFAQARCAALGEPARALILADRYPEAGAAAREALAWYPYDTDLMHIRLAAMKSQGEWQALAGLAAAAAPWYPDGSALWPLAGEAAFQLGKYGEAAPLLWKYLWREPMPERSPAALWGMALRAGRSAWGDRDPRVVTAALEVMALAGGDRAIDAAGAAMRRAMVEDCAAVFEAASAPETAAAARALLAPD